MLPLLLLLPLCCTDMLCEELQGLRRENEDLFRAVMQVMPVLCDL